MNLYSSERDVEAKLIQPLFHDVLGYPDEQLQWGRRVDFQMGRERRVKHADLVVNWGGRPVITVEAKRPTETLRSAFSQADSYAFALQTPYSVITNGQELVLRGYYSFNSRINLVEDSVDRLADSKWADLISLISFANIQESLGETPNQVEPPSPERIKDYRRFFRRIHNAIRDRDRLDPGAAFDELSKLLFLRAAEDEWRRKSPSRPVLTPEKIEEWEELDRGGELVNDWFRAAVTKEFPNLFDHDPHVALSTSTLKEVLRLLAPFRTTVGDVDVKGRAFEEFLPSQLRGSGLGQYFTPRPIVDFMANMAEISIHDVVVDFACGSGGFLIKAFEHMKERVEQLPDGTLARLGLTRDELLEDIKAGQIFGVDAEPRAARTAKMNMLMWGDGKRVVRGNALAERDMHGDAYEPGEYAEGEPGSGCTLILANPPFGSKEKDSEVLGRYELGSKLSERKSEKTEILFIEKGLKLLRPEGRMLIVLPQGIFSGRKYTRVRDFIHSRAEIRAIVSLPTHTFVQSGVPTVNTCVVYLQRFTKEKQEMYRERTKGLSDDEVRTLLRTDEAFDYPIFMASAEFIGYEPSGRSIVGPDEATDLDEILTDFRDQATLTPEDVDPFEYAAEYFGEKSSRRRDQTVRGTRRGLKTSFVVHLSETEDRLDPPFHFFRQTAGEYLDTLEPLGDNIEVISDRFTPSSDDELDAEYTIISVSSDGQITPGKHLSGEEFTQPYKRVHSGDIVYNPSRINIGSIGVVPGSLNGAFASPEYVVFRPNEWDSDFLVRLLRSPFYRLYIDIVATGSIRDRVLVSELETIRVPAVTEADQGALISDGRAVDHQADALVAEVREKRAELSERFHDLVIHAQRENLADIAIARERLEAMKSDPDVVVRGEELDEALRKID